MKSYKLIPASLLEFIRSNDKVNFNKTIKLITTIMNCNSRDRFAQSNLATAFNNVKNLDETANLITILLDRLRLSSSKKEFDNFYYYIKTLLEFDIGNNSIITRYIKWNEKRGVLSKLIASCRFSAYVFKTEEEIRDAICKCKDLIFFIFHNFINESLLVEVCSTLVRYYKSYFYSEFDEDKQKRLNEIRDAIFTYINVRQLLGKVFYNIPYLQFCVEKNNIEESIKYATSIFPKLKEDEYFIKFISKFINRYVTNISSTYSSDEETLKDFAERSKKEINNKLKEFGFPEYICNKRFIYCLFSDFINDIQEEKIHLRDVVLFNYLAKLTDDFSNEIGVHLKKDTPNILSECNNKYFYKKFVELGWKESKKSKQLFSKLREPVLITIVTRKPTKMISVKDIPTDVDEVKHKKLLESFIHATKCLTDIRIGIQVLREAIDANNINLLKILMKLNINPFVKDDLGSAVDYCKKVGNKEAEKVLKSYYTINTK